eukprot:6176561-Pleurochrysis_carterae.AAC.3
MLHSTGLQSRVSVKRVVPQATEWPEGKLLRRDSEDARNCPDADGGVLASARRAWRAGLGPALARSSQKKESVDGAADGHKQASRARQIERSALLKRALSLSDAVLVESVIYHLFPQ